MKWKLHLSIATATIILILLITTIYIQGVSSRQIRVACIGDSITRCGYPTLLRSMLGRNYAVANFGVDGSTATLGSKIPYMNQTEYQRALQFRPDIVIIMLGTNDANPEISAGEQTFELDYARLISSFQELGGYQAIWLVKSPPIYSTNSAYDNSLLTQKVLPQIDSLASQMRLPTIDVYSAMSNHSEYFADGVHPNSDGAAVIASNIYAAITNPDGSPNYSLFQNDYSG
jgi:acyl-CoA thioesterase-1